MRMVWIRRATWTGLACLMLACGGGGSDGGGDDPASGPTGFVPTAPTPGAVLYAQASTLRPLRAGSRWSYRTADYPNGRFGQSTVKQTAGATAGAIQEVDSSAPSDVSTVSLDGSGNVLLAAQLVLVPGTTGIAINSVELNATVRANEQLVLFDRRIASSGIDVDRDGRQDRLELAIWRRVVDNEDITLPNFAGTLRALRVDTFATARITPSGGGAPQTESTQVSTWYAPGIGIVRNATPGTAGRPHDTDDVLLGYDGVSAGWGWIVNEEFSWEFRSVANRPLFALALPEGALVDGGQTLYRVDRNGKVLASADFTPGGGLPVKRGMLRFASGTRIMTGAFPTFAVYTINEASAAASAAALTIDLSGRTGQFPVDLDVSFVSDPAAPLAWAIWQRSFTATPSVQAWEIVLRRLDSTGLLGGEIRLALDSTSTQVRARPTANGMVVTWVDYAATGEYTNRVVFVSNSGAIANDQGWVTPRPTGSSDWPTLNVLTDAGTAWLLWDGPTASSDALSPHGLRLDAAGSPVGTGVDTAALRAASIGVLDGAAAAGGWWSRLTATGGHWYTIAQTIGLVYPDDPAPSFWLDLREFNPGAGALAGNIQTQLMFRIPTQQPLYVPPIVFDDRILLLTDDAQFVRPTVIWRR